MKNVQLNIPYYKRGDDFGGHLKHNKNNVTKALGDYYDQINEAAQNILKIKEILSKYNNEDLDLNADCHCIELSAPNKIIKELEENDLIEVWEETEL